MYAEAVEALSACQFHELHLVARGMAVDAGYINYAAAAACELDQWDGIELGGHGGIYGNAPAGTQMEIAISVVGDESRCVGTVDGGYAAPLGAQLLPQCSAIVRRYGCTHEVKYGLGDKKVK